jgi:hypothetical protein
MPCETRTCPVCWTEFTVTGPQVLQSLRDAEQSGAISRNCGYSLRSQPEQLGTAAPVRRGCVVGDLYQPPQIGVQQVSIVAEQVIDQSGGGGVSRQRPQQVIRGILPIAELAILHERLRDRSLVFGLRHGIGPRVQQRVVQRLMEQAVHGDARAVTGCGNVPASFHQEVGRR